jgi:hypothetical protein
MKYMRRSVMAAAYGVDVWFQDMFEKKKKAKG